MTDEAILQLAKQPQTREEGFRQLVLAYQERLYQVVRRQLPSHDDADDVLQNTFLKIFRHLDGFEGRSELYTWMYRITQNEIINFFKRQNRMKTVSLGNYDAPHEESPVDSEELILSLESAVNRLPERQQMVFRMRYYDELSYKQIAEMLQLTEGALKASFHHAVKKIEEEFKSRSLL
ncbi:MAG TPA: RNA polymerase sigma factor [Saprospiraceae bacterium]|nr:RNA polymerase sigma factor [Saprospiraceae bacterium]